MSHSEWILDDANCVGYWPLASDGTDSKGGNSLILTNVTFVNNMAYFNGSNASALTTSAIDLSATNKVTVVSKINLITLNQSAAALFYELGSNPVTDGTINLLTRGDLAGDPVAALCTGNVGQSQAGYFAASTRYNTGGSHFYAATYDFSLTTSEAKLSMDGIPLPIDSQISNNNNTGSFSSALKMYVGSRGGTTAWANIYISDIAIFSRILTEHEIRQLNIFYKGSPSLSLNGGKFKTRLH